MGRSKYQQEIEDAQEVLGDALEALGFDLSDGNPGLERVAWMLRNRALAQADSLERIRARSRNEREKLAEAEAALKETQGRLRQAEKGIHELNEAIEERGETIRQLHGRAMGAESQVAALEGARRVDAVSIGRLQALLNRLADAFWQNDRDNLAELKKPKA